MDVAMFDLKISVIVEICFIKNILKSIKIRYLCSYRVLIIQVD